MHRSHTGSLGQDRKQVAIHRYANKQKSRRHPAEQAQQETRIAEPLREGRALVCSEEVVAEA